MKTIYSMMLATALFVTVQVIQAQPVVTEEWHEECVVVNQWAYCPGDTGYEQANQLIEDCLSDMTLDWESESCDFMRPEGDTDI